MLDRQLQSSWFFNLGGRVWDATARLVVHLSLLLGT